MKVTNDLLDAGNLPKITTDGRPILTRRMIIQTSQHSSLKQFERFWQAALAYQTERNLPLWSPFPAATIAGEINESRHFSGYVSGNTLAGFFSITLADPVIWGEADNALLPGVLDGLDALVPELRIARLPQASHWVAHDAPAEVEALIREFVA